MELDAINGMRGTKGMELGAIIGMRGTKAVNYEGLFRLERLRKRIIQFIT